MKKILILYYSWSNGNTKSIAESLRKATGGDIVALQTATPYTGSYDDVVDQGKREVESGFCPALKPLPVSLEDYDVIALGTPTWWYTMAPAVLSFLSEQDLSGKTFIPFMTNAGWPGSVLSDMESHAKGAHVILGKEFLFDSSGGSRMVTSSEELNAWINRVKDYCQS